MIKRIAEAITKAESVDELRHEVEVLRHDVNELANALRNLAEVVRDHNSALHVAAQEHEHILELLGKPDEPDLPDPTSFGKRSEKPN